MRDFIGFFVSIFVLTIIINERIETNEGLPLYMVFLGILSFGYALLSFSNLAKKEKKRIYHDHEL